MPYVKVTAVIRVNVPREHYRNDPANPLTADGLAEVRHIRVGDMDHVTIEFDEETK